MRVRDGAVIGAATLPHEGPRLNLRGVHARLREPGGLYALVDPDQAGSHGPLALAEAAVRAGAVALQLRAKHDRDGATLELGRALRRLTRDAGVVFVVNDRADLADLLEADMLHLGQDDLPIEVAAPLVPGMPISLSTHSRAQAEDAVRRGAVAVGYGPVFDTRSKLAPDPTVGLASLAEVARAVPVPVIAIGGIERPRLPEVARSGAACFAVISALAHAADPEQEARAMIEAFTQAR